jgi:hypothetical protein
MMTSLTPADDYLHRPSNHPNWRESYYFNWVDLKAGICGFSTVALLPNIPKRELVLAVFVDGNPELYLAEPHTPIPQNLTEAFSDGHLAYALGEPFGSWSLSFAGPRFSLEAHWQPRFKPYEFGRGSGVTWGRHLEQSGRMTGILEFTDGPKYRFDGVGQRDKSWGVRDWHIDGWFHVMAQFDDFMIGFRRDVVAGKAYVSGCVSSAKMNIPVTEVSVDTKFVEETIRKPVEAKIRLRDAKGRSYALRSRLIAPLTFARYTRQFRGGETELFEELVIFDAEEPNQQGVGLAEWIITHRASQETPKR